MRRRVLMVAYQFPPVGGAGVQRVVKLCKYLPRHDWSVSVLTVDNHSVPTTDNSLCRDIPPETWIRKARTLEPAYRLKQVVQSTGKNDALDRGLRRRVLAVVRRAATAALQPDPQVLWVPAAIRKGLQLLSEAPHDAILVSGPPFSSFLVGAALRKLTGTPLVLDYRDEWGLTNRYWENRGDTAWSRLVQEKLQRWVIRHAQALVATTGRSAESLRAEVDRATARRSDGPPPVHCLYNGFDPGDFPAGKGDPTQHDSAERAAERGRRFRLAHVGTLWRLTSSLPLWQAVERLAAEHPQLASRLDLELVGRSTPEEVALAERFRDLPCRVIRRNYVDHSEAVNIMRAADELCLLLAETCGSQRVLPGKTFEYLASQRPILAIIPEGETRDVLTPHAGVATFRPEQIGQIAQHLAERIRLLETAPVPGHARQLEPYDRCVQAGQMARILDQAAAMPVPGPRLPRVASAGS